MTKPQESSLHTIKDVEFYYSSVTYKNKQQNKDNKPPKSDHELEFHSYEIKIALDEERFKKFKKVFKGAHNLVYAKDYDPQEFKEAMRLDEAPDGDRVMIKFAQPCLSGKASDRKLSTPITQIGIRGRVQDRNGKEITGETQLGNGTKGHFQFRVADLGEMTYLYPVAICVTELVEYAGGKQGADEDAFDMEELAEAGGGGSTEEYADDFDDNIDF